MISFEKDMLESLTAVIPNDSDFASNSPNHERKTNDIDPGQIGQSKDDGRYGGMFNLIKKFFPQMKSLKEDQTAISNSGSPAECGENDKIDFGNVKIEEYFEDQVDFETFSKSDFRAVKVKDCVAVPKSKKLLQFTLDDGTGTDRTILSGIHAFYEPEELIGKTLIAITNLPPRPMMGIESCGMLLSAVNKLKDSDEEELHLIMVDNHIPAGAKLY